MNDGEVPPTPWAPRPGPPQYGPPGPPGPQYGPPGPPPPYDNRVMWFGADGTAHYATAYPPPAPPPPPRRKTRWKLWVAVGVVAAVLLCGGPVAFVATQLPLLPAGRAEAANPSPTAVSSPPPGASVRERAPWVRSQIEAGLRQQTKALLAGDQKAFLATADAKTGKFTAALKRRFTSLRELEVTRYEQEIISGPVPRDESGGGVQWQVRIRLQHCFVALDCAPDPLLFETRWAETPDGLRMIKLEADGTENGPRPWEVSALKAAVGKRVVVASTNRYAGRLPALLKEAEKAAAVADRYVLDGQKPDRYRIFIAGPSEWKKWYGGDLPQWSVGFATSVSAERMEVVLNIEEIESSYLDEVLRHELGHVATLSTEDYAHEGNFWLIEGIAEYIQERGRPVGRYDGRFAVRRYVDSGKWNGSVAVSEPTESSKDWQVAARYGIGYYAVRRMAERFGEEKMIEFFRAVVLDGGVALETAAQQAFGVSWKNVDADCARYIRRQT